MQPETPGTIAWRVRQIERDMEEQAEPAIRLVRDHEQQINGKTGVIVQLDRISEELRSLRRTVFGVGASIVTAAVVLMILQRILPT